MAIIVKDRAAVACSACMKRHQLRLIEDSRGAVAVLGGKPMSLPGRPVDQDPKGTFELAVALVVEFTRKDSRYCPLDAWV